MGLHVQNAHSKILESETMFGNGEIKALFLDMDGTLINTLPWLLRAYCDVKQQLGQKPCADEFEKLNGASIKEIATALKPNHMTADHVAQKLVLARANYLPQKAHLFAGVLEFLTRCDDENLMLWLVTSANRSVAAHLLEHCKILPLFRGLITSENVTFSKPNPEIYYSALSQARLGPHQVLAFEDSIQGISSASQAGLPVILFNADLTIKKDQYCNASLLKRFDSWNNIQKWFFESAN